MLALKKYISSKESQQIIYKLRLAIYYKNGIPKIVNLSNTESNQPFRFRTRNWVEINDNARGNYFSTKQIRFKTSMLRSSLCDYIDAYIIVKG